MPRVRQDGARRMRTPRPLSVLTNDPPLLLRRPAPSYGIWLAADNKSAKARDTGFAVASATMPLEPLGPGAGVCPFGKRAPACFASLFALAVE